MSARKVLQMGGGTVLISLPKAWAARNGVTKGGSVLVEEISPRRLMVSPAGHEEREVKTTVIEYPKESIAHVINDITGAYLIGSNVIRVEGRQVIGREDRERIKGMARRLVGLEIMDEDSKSLTLQFLLEPSALDPEKIVKRMGGLTRGMLKDAGEALREEDSKVMPLIAERDDEVDRLYFLLVRAIRTATIDAELAERYGLSPVECLDYRVLASFLEGLGDTVAEFSKRAAGEPPVGVAAREISDVFAVLEEMEEISVRSFLERKQSRVRSAYLQLDAMKRQVDGSLRAMTESRGVSTRLVVDLLSMLERMAKTFIDISDLSLPSYQFAENPR